MNLSRTIDAHHHFWKTAAQAQPWRTQAHAALERDFGPAELREELAAAGVDATVLMQSVDEPAENERLAEYAKEPRIAGVVAWLPLKSGLDALRELSRVDIPKLRGVRCLVADDPLEWLADDSTVELFREIAERELVWDVVPITSAQIRAVLQLANAVPELKIVVDHLGRPPLEDQGWEPWASHVRDLASNPNVAMKVSVGINALTAWNEWDASLLDRYVGHAYDQFGASRLMLASNWPVVLLRAGYRQAWNDLTAVVGRILSDSDERSQILGCTAEKWYRLDRTSDVIGEEAGQTDTAQ